MIYSIGRIHSVTHSPYTLYPQYTLPQYTPPNTLSPNTFSLDTHSPIHSPPIRYPQIYTFFFTNSSTGTKHHRRDSLGFLIKLIWFNEPIYVFETGILEMAVWSWTRGRNCSRRIRWLLDRNSFTFVIISSVVLIYLYVVGHSSRTITTKTKRNVGKIMIILTSL